MRSGDCFDEMPPLHKYKSQETIQQSFSGMLFEILFASAANGAGPIIGKLFK
jgi:hypothetical protein